MYDIVSFPSYTHQFSHFNFRINSTNKEKSKMSGRHIINPLILSNMCQNEKILNVPIFFIWVRMLSHLFCGNQTSC